MQLLAAGLVAASLLTASPSRAGGTQETMVETAPGVSIHAIVAGERGRRPDIVLIPGWRLTVGIWRDQMARLARDGRVVAIDPRSQGGSTKTPDGDTPETRAQDLKAVIAKLGLGPVVLVGWSQGVQDVAAYVDQFGTENLRGVVLVDSTVSAGAPAIAASPAVAAGELGLLQLYNSDPRGYTEGMMRAIIRRPLSRAELDRLVDDALKTPTAIGAAMLVDDLFGPDRTGALAKMKLPTLVIASDQSSELEAQRAMAARLPSGRFVAVADAGHAVFVDQPEKFELLVRGFVEEAERSSTGGG